MKNLPKQFILKKFNMICSKNTSIDLKEQHILKRLNNESDCWGV